MKKHRVFGENTPLWLALVLALIGIAGGVEAALRIMTPAESAAFRLPVLLADLASLAGIEAASPGPQRPGGGDAEAGKTVASAGNGNLRLAAEAWRRLEGKDGAAPREPSAQPQTLPPAATSGAGTCAPVFAVMFAHGSSGFKTSAYEAAATRLREWSNHHPNAKIRLEGHTDATGDEEFNLLFSHRRAKAVADLLVKAGIPSWRMNTRALGQQPVTASVSAGDLNRRVVIRVDGFPDCPGASANQAS